MVCWKRLAIVCASHREAVCCRMKYSRDSCAKRQFTTEIQRHREALSFKFQVLSCKPEPCKTKEFSVPLCLLRWIYTNCRGLPMHLSATGIDLRSDTVTKPSPEMRRAMFEAEVGDDVYGEDPTINRLEKRAAEVFGREAALFVPSGTMGNQIAIKLHTHHGQEVICEERGHVFNYEMAMMAHFSGVVPRTVWAEDGILTWPHVQSKLKT